MAIIIDLSLLTLDSRRQIIHSYLLGIYANATWKCGLNVDSLIKDYKLLTTSYVRSREILILWLPHL
jgi:hypothetical protein